MLPTYQTHTITNNTENLLNLALVSFCAFVNFSLTLKHANIFSQSICTSWWAAGGKADASCIDRNVRVMLFANIHIRLLCHAHSLVILYVRGKLCYQPLRKKIHYPPDNHHASHLEKCPIPGHNYPANHWYWWPDTLIIILMALGQ